MEVNITGLHHVTYVMAQLMRHYIESYELCDAVIALVKLP